MSYKMSWAVPNVVVYQKIYDSFNLQELTIANAEVIRYLDQQQPHQPVHHIVHIVDMSGFIYKTEDFRKVSNFQSALTYIRHPNLGCCCAVGSNRIIRTIGGLAYAFYKVRYRSYELNQLDKAINYLRTVDYRLETAEFDFSETNQLAIPQ